MLRSNIRLAFSADSIKLFLAASGISALLTFSTRLKAELYFNFACLNKVLYVLNTRGAASVFANVFIPAFFTTIDEPKVYTFSAEDIVPQK